MFSDFACINAMRIKELHLTNIGPFNDAHLEFAADDAPRVTIITGENGTGKTIVLDAIRELFGKNYADVERNIYRDLTGFEVRLLVNFRGREETIISKGMDSRVYLDDNFDSVLGTELVRNNSDLSALPYQVKTQEQPCPNWVVDYWRSTSFIIPFAIEAYKAPKLRHYLQDSLQGNHKNTDTTELICYFDTLRDSRDSQEQKIGNIVFDVLEKIIKASLLEGGKLKFVRRAELMPIIEQNGMEVPLSNLSSGNLYMIQRLVSLLGKMYAVHILRQTPPETLCETPGLLLIDEAENHLHPKWQKRFIPTILEIFPNLQIIATTHSPFIVSSVEGAKVYVCKPHTDHCTIEEGTAPYYGMPVDDILLDPVFAETEPFSTTMTDLLEKRRNAIVSGNDEERNKIEGQLKRINPEHFAYLDIDALLDSMTREAA